jgi:hypothetical protein
MLCLAITWVLVLVVFLYFRYKMGQYEDRLNLLTTTVQTMAGFNFKVKPEIESDSESESEYESEEEETKVFHLPEPLNERVWMEPIRLEKLDEPKRTVSDDEVTPVYTNSPVSVSPVSEVEPDVKAIEMSAPEKTLEDLTVKELKEKVALLNGPKLKTKKELIDFLQLKSNVEL